MLMASNGMTLENFSQCRLNAAFELREKSLRTLKPPLHVHRQHRVARVLYAHAPSMADVHCARIYRAADTRAHARARM